MYEVLDNFLAIDTWDTRHPFDEQRFYEALDKIVWLEEFNADQMAEYMRGKLKLRYGDDLSAFEVAVDHYQTSAWAVRDFLRYSETVSKMKTESNSRPADGQGGHHRTH